MTKAEIHSPVLRALYHAIKWISIFLVLFILRYKS